MSAFVGAVCTLAAPASSIYCRSLYINCKLEKIYLVCASGRAILSPENLQNMAGVHGRGGMPFMASPAVIMHRRLAWQRIRNAGLCVS